MSCNNSRRLSRRQKCQTKSSGNKVEMGGGGVMIAHLVSATLTGRRVWRPVLSWKRILVQLIEGGVHSIV